MRSAPPSGTIASAPVSVTRARITSTVRSNIVARSDVTCSGSGTSPKPSERMPLTTHVLLAILRSATTVREELTRAGLERLRPVVEAFAEIEGMPAHAKAMNR